MAFTTLISTADLHLHLYDADWVVVDCRHNLADPGQGQQDYLQRHIAGAVFAHVDDDLSGPIIPGATGRHPLPLIEAAAATLSRLGVDATMQVVAYDDRGGMTAARLWWMLRWLGHDRAAVLDGGWPHWQREGRPTRAGIETHEPRVFIPHVRPELAVDAATVQQRRTDPAYRVVDSRAADRYRGENETIDPIGGHIPGALSAPFADNLVADGKFRSPDELRERFTALLGDTSAEHTVFYCGSGVSAAHNLLALARAGMGEATLYPGSWSEWIIDPARPVATGSEPGQ